MLLNKISRGMHPARHKKAAHPEAGKNLFKE
jgi:hypothetical protein